MPHLNVYIDKDTLTKVETAAKIEGSSVSKWVRKRITHALENTWPEGYFDLFGALADVDIEPPEQLSFEDDAPRESL